MTDQTKTELNNCRAAFEEWYDRHHGGLLDTKWLGEHYDDIHVDDQWDCWQAAWNTHKKPQNQCVTDERAQDRQSALDALEHLIEMYSDDQDDFDQFYINEQAAKIRAALTQPVAGNPVTPSPDVIGEVVELLDCWKDYSFLREDVGQEEYPDIRERTDKALLAKLKELPTENVSNSTPYELKYEDGDWIITNGTKTLFRHTDRHCILNRMIDSCLNGVRQPEFAKPAVDLEGLRELKDAAKAVIDRWDSPDWKDTVHTGGYIHRLKSALQKFEGA